MRKSRTDLAWDTFLDLAQDTDGPLHVRLTRAVRDAIRDGVLAPGSALPPSRTLAQDLACSRWVVTESYGQLVAEGYLEARPGAATRVSATAHGREPAGRPYPPRRPPPARFDLAPGFPDLRAFPRKRWLDALRTVLDDVPFSDLGIPDPAGHPRLRTVIAEYLGRVRAAAASAEDVTVTHGASEAIARLARSMRGEGMARVAVEDPSWTRLVDVLRAAGLDVMPVPVDDQGMRVALLAGAGCDAALVAPAHQFPTGVVLSPERRTALLDWAAAEDALVIEDDYDAEYRYDRRPMSTLQGMAPDRVALTGSVSKTLAPAMRQGWIVAPARWRRGLRAGTSGPPPVLDQLALAELMTSGGYDRHLRAARQRYRARRDALLRSLGDRLPDCEPSGAAAGLHLLLRLPPGVLGTEVVARADHLGLHTATLAGYRVEPGSDDRLVIGYANLTDGSVAPAVDLLARAIAEASG